MSLAELAHSLTVERCCMACCVVEWRVNKSGPPALLSRKSAQPESAGGGRGAQWDRRSRSDVDGWRRGFEPEHPRRSRSRLKE